MKFAVIGGDRRSVLLCAQLLADGNRVHSYALEKAELPEEVPKAGCLESAVYGAEAVILPAPAERDGWLKAPLGAAPCSMEALSAALWPGQTVIGGGFQEDWALNAAAAGLHVKDVLRRPEYVTANAAITAEGALGLLLQESEGLLLGSSVLLCGWGRIARFLAWRLLALGARVTAVSRRPAHRAEARALGCGALGYGELAEVLPEMELVVNTAPERVLTEEMLCCCREGALLLELASPPGGFDRTLAENLGLRALAAPGLPGKSAPRAAAALMRRTVYQVIREDEDV